MLTYCLKSHYVSVRWILFYLIWSFILMIFVFLEERDIKVEQNYIFSLIFNRCGLRKSNWANPRWVKCQISNHKWVSVIFSKKNESNKRELKFESKFAFKNWNNLNQKINKEILTTKPIQSNLFRLLVVQGKKNLSLYIIFIRIQKVSYDFEKCQKYH